MNMKRLFTLLSFIVSIGVACAQQNHVPNPSFEDMLGCPYSQGQVTLKCAQWHTVTATPDYYNACATGTNAPSVPLNPIGYQAAARGNAYCGIQPYNLGDHMEYIGAHITPLVPGQVYEVSMSVSLADKSSRATNNIGVHFYNDTNFSYAMPGLLPVTAQIHYTSYGPIHDTTGWVRLTQYFLADSAYENMVIGPFEDSAHALVIDTVDHDPLAPIVSYYYIDSVVVRLKPASVETTPAIGGLTLYPNPNNGSFVLQGNLQTDKSLKITVVNALGRLVYTGDIKTLQGALDGEIKLDDMAPGIYLLRASDDAGNSNTVRFRIE